MVKDPTPSRILVVDDDPMSVMLLGRILKDAGFDVATAGSAEAALPLVSSVDLILLDVSLPGMDGFELARKIKEDQASTHLPIIFISSHSKAFDKRLAFEAGASDYITKPFDFDEVRLRVDNQLRLSSLQLEVRHQNAELRAKNQELERFVSAIRDRAIPLTDTGERSALEDEPSAQGRGRDRIFTALSEVLPGTVLDRKVSP